MPGQARPPSAELFPALTDPSADGNSDRIALSFPDRSLTYSDLAAASGRIASELTARRTERAAVLAESRIETCVAVVGALLAGVAVVPINPRSGTSELAHIVADADPDVLLCPADGASAPAGLDRAEQVVIDLDHAASGGRDASAPPTPRDRAPSPPTPEDPALIVYTSGTTGPPKGAVLPRRAISSNLDALADAWAWTGRDVVAHALPLFHVHGLVIGILGPLRRGGRALHLGKFSPEAVQSALAIDATMLFGVPTMYRRLADAAEDSPALATALGRARLLVSGSAGLPASEHERLRELTGRGVVERYGMTETLMNTAVRADAEPAPGTVGPPLPGVELRLVDDDGNEIRGGAGEQDSDAGVDETIGQIEVRGPNLMLGYLNRPDATEAAIRDGWFSTGDMATRDASGSIRLVGRLATDLIKSGGYKIGAGEIEGSLREHPAVQDAAVTGESDEDLGERVVAWVVLDQGAAADEQELIDHVATELAPHKRPRIVHFLDELPRNELGKVQKQRLSAPPSRA